MTRPVVHLWTEGDLAGLPVGSVVLDPGGYAWQKADVDQWVMAGVEGSKTSTEFLRFGPTASPKYLAPLLLVHRSEGAEQ